MKEALSHLLSDLLSAILFLAVYLTTANITVAAAVAITVGLAQIAVQRLAGRRIWPMQWISLAVVIVLAAASIATQSPRFVMLKPSLGHFAIAVAMLKRGWMSRYLPEVAQRYLPENVPIIAGYAWSGLMAAIGLANILIALYAPFAIWVWFISVGAIGAKVAAFVLQYAVFRTIIRRTRRRAAGAAIGAVRGPSSALLGVVAGLILLTSSGDAGVVGFQQAADPDAEVCEGMIRHPATPQLRFAEPPFRCGDGECGKCSVCPSRCAAPVSTPARYLSTAHRQITGR